MTSKSKSKGNSLEREVRDFLNNIYECDEFARTPSSGAIMGLSNAKRNAGLNAHTKQTLGSDLICPDWFNFSIECKNYKDDPNYSTILKSNDRLLDLWLGEALFDSINLELIPCLVFKTNRKGTHVALPAVFFLHMEFDYVLKYREFIIFGLDQFEHNKDVIKDPKFNPLVQQWLLKSQYVTDLLINLRDEKSKNKKSDGIKDSIDAMLDMRTKK